MANNSRFETITQHTCEMSKEQAEARFFSVEHTALLSYYEQGAILEHGRKTWFEGNNEQAQAAYEGWVLDTLRIPLDKAAHLRKVYGAIRASGLHEDDFRGIPVSSVLAMVPILRNQDLRDELPALLQLARENTFKVVKGRCAELRGLKPSLPQMSAVSEFKRADWSKCVEILAQIAKVANERGMEFAFVLKDNPENSNLTHQFSTGDTLRKHWKETISFMNHPIKNEEAMEKACQNPEPEVEVVASLDMGTGDPVQGEGNQQAA